MEAPASIMPTVGETLTDVKDLIFCLVYRLKPFGTDISYTKPVCFEGACYCTAITGVMADGSFSIMTMKDNRKHSLLLGPEWNDGNWAKLVDGFDQYCDKVIIRELEHMRRRSKWHKPQKPTEIRCSKCGCVQMLDFDDNIPTVRKHNNGLVPAPRPDFNQENDTNNKVQD